MKLNKLIIIFLSVLMFTSCSEWLDVTPLGEIEADEQINTAQGFQEILDGAYIAIARPQLYGKELSFGLVEEVTLNYYFDYSDTRDYVWNYDHASRIQTIDGVFLNAYKVIGNLNYLLDNIEGKEDLFAENQFEMMVAEAKAMRAFLHFDLLRAFAVNYTDDSEALAIPYVDVFEKRIFKHMPASEVADKIIADLGAAEELLAANDPIVGLSYENNNDQLTERKFAFNYYAVMAIKARVYQYIGDKTNASQYAQKVLDEFPFEWTNYYDIEQNSDGYQKVFFKENILCIDAYNLYDTYISSFSSGEKPYRGGDERYEVAKAGIFDIKEDGDGKNDSRFTFCFTYDANGLKNLSTKYMVDSDNPVTVVPLIKISEMSLILAENLAGTDKPRAIELINEIRTWRDVNELAEDITEQEVMDAVYKEFRKETYLEGQFFYLNKRMGKTQILSLRPRWNGDPSSEYVDMSIYTLPMPQNEIEFGDGSRIEN